MITEQREVIVGLLTSTTSTPTRNPLQQKICHPVSITEPETPFHSYNHENPGRFTWARPGITWARPGSRFISKAVQGIRLHPFVPSHRLNDVVVTASVQASKAQEIT